MLYDGHVKVLEIINENEKIIRISWMKSPNVFNTPEIRIECDDKLKFKIIEKLIVNLKKENQKIIDLDGVRVLKEDGWWLLRASNTQPALCCKMSHQQKMDWKYKKKIY